MEFRYVIRYLLRKNYSLGEIVNEMESTYDDISPKYPFIARWVREYKNGRDSAADVPKPGRPLEIDFESLRGPVANSIETDRRISIESLAATHSVSIGTMYHIVTQLLGMKKLTTKWVPHVLTNAHKSQRIASCKNLLQGYKKQPNSFLKALVTMDESWIYAYDPLTRTEAMEWVQSSEEVTRRAKVDFRRQKVLLCLWWDWEGILYPKFLESGNTVNADEYCMQLDAVDEKLRSDRPNRPDRKPVFLQDNARPHKAKKSMEKINDLGWIALDHPPYSPDLAPSDYWIFRKLKKNFRAKVHNSKDELMAAVQAFFREQPVTWFQEGLSRLPERWQRCIDLKGDYVEELD